MTPLDRKKILRDVERIMNDGGISMNQACRIAGTNKAFYYRWKGRLDTAMVIGLSDASRSGRPCKEEDDLLLAQLLDEQERKIKTIEGTISTMKNGIEKIRKSVTKLSGKPKQ